MELRPHQSEAKSQVYDAINRGERRIILQAPVGWGKTIWAASIIQDIRSKYKRSIFCAPAISLIDQTVDKLYQNDLRDIGVLQAQHPMTAPHRPIQVCSVQTLQRREVPPASCVFIDEAHMQFQFVNKWMSKPEWQDVPFIGMTATPWARGMGKHWSTLIRTSSMEELTDQGWLKRIRYFQPMGIDTTGIRMIRGDYHEGELSKVSRGKAILADTVEQWLRHGDNRPTIAFCVDRAHARDMQERFLAVGVPCEYIDANTDAEERAAIGRRMESGQAKVTVSVGCLIAGLDWTFIGCILFSRKTKSHMLWVQGIGRGVRQHPDYDDLILLDCAGNSELGHPYDIDFPYLDRGTKADKDRKQRDAEEIREPKKCLECGAVRQAGVKACPECGFEPAQQSNVVEYNQQLVEDNRSGKEKMAEFLQEDLQEWYSSLLSIRDQRGYKQGWAANMFKDKFHCWPQDYDLHDAALDAPAPIVSSWVKHKFIKYARRRK